MWYAIEANTDKQVHAGDGSPHRMYRCPVCRGEVFLRCGQRYAHHFAHLHETAKPECALYTPGKSQLDPHRMPVHAFTGDDRVARDKLKILPPEVCIEVEDRQSRGRGRLPRWNLCVTIPKSIDGRGTLTFDFGAASQRTIALSKLLGGPVTYPADSDADDFKAIWCSPETNPAYQEIITERRPGLNKHGLTPFVGAPRRYKRRARRLMWGRAYYFVWPKTFDPKFPSAFETLAFEDNKDWSCVLGTLPETCDENWLEWLAKGCSVGVDNPSASWSLLYPFFSAYTYDDRIEIPAVGRLILGYDQTREVGETDLQSRVIADGERIEMRLPDQASGIVALTYAERVPNVFELIVDHQVSFGFRSLDSTLFAEPPTVWAEFESPTKGAARASLHAVAARKWLEEVRTSRAQLKGITLPEAASGELAWRNSPVAAWNRAMLNRKDGKARRGLHEVKLGRDELERIQTVLRSTGDEVRISFRGLGEHHFLGMDDDCGRVVRLSRQLRNRILWLQKEAAIVYGGGRPVAENVSDRELIQRFIALTPPPSLAAHYQSIRKSIGDPISKAKNPQAI